MNVTVEIHTEDATWAAKHGTPAPEGRTAIPGCTITGGYTFRGREWVNYQLPAGLPIPADWKRKGCITTALAAPAEWVHPAENAFLSVAL